MSKWKRDEAKGTFEFFMIKAEISAPQHIYKPLQF
jgi:hypothetical protein